MRQEGSARRAASLVSVVLALGAAACRRGSAPSFEGAAPRLLSSAEELEIDAAFSPDGSEMAYASARSGRFEIRVRRLSDGADRALTNDGKQNFQPCFSPDGATVVYHSKDRIGLWTVPAKGGEPRPLADFGSRPKFSPDGSLVAFQSEEFNAIAANAASPPSTIWVVPADGGPARSVTTQAVPKGGHGSPVFTPDGKRICFLSQEAGQGDVVLSSIGVDGRGLVPILRLPRIYEPVVAPDGETLYFGGASGDLFSLMTARVSPETGEVKDKPRSLGPPSSDPPRQLALSRDGGELVWSLLQSRGALFSLEVGPDGSAVGEPRRLTSGALRDTRPAFSRDGARIVFDRRTEGESENVWVMDADGAHPDRLTHRATSTYARDFFPDGRRVFAIVVGSERRATEALAIDIATKAEERLPLPVEDVGPARLSPDGTRIAFHALRGGKTWNLFTARFGEAPVQLTFDLEQVGYPVFSPDGSTLAFDVKRGDDIHVAVMPSGGGTPTQLTNDPGLSWPTGFSPDGDKVVFAGLRTDGWNLYWVSRTTREIRKLTRPVPLTSYVRNPAWSPRGDRIVYERTDTRGDLMLMEAGAHGPGVGPPAKR